MSEKLTLKEKLKLEKSPKKVEKVVPIKNEVKSIDFTLCVDCYPIKTDKQIILLNDYLKPVLKRIEEDTGLPHYKLMKYGEGAGLLAAELKVELKNNPPPAGCVIYIEVLGNVGKDCLDELEAAATAIYKRT